MSSCFLFPFASDEICKCITLCIYDYTIVFHLVKGWSKSFIIARIIKIIPSTTLNQSH